MTNEELEKATQFILEQQVQFAANQQQMDERVSRLETNMAELALAQTHNYEVVTVMAHEQTRMDEVVTVMAREQTHINEVVTVLARTQTHLDELVAVMLDTHRQTEERLDAFIVVLERYISEGRNGGSNGESAT